MTIQLATALFAVAVFLVIPVAMMFRTLRRGTHKAEFRRPADVYREERRRRVHDLNDLAGRAGESVTPPA